MGGGRAVALTLVAWRWASGAARERQRSTVSNAKGARPT